MCTLLLRVLCVCVCCSRTVTPSHKSIAPQLSFCRVCVANISFSGVSSGGHTLLKSNAVLVKHSDQSGVRGFKGAIRSVENKLKLKLCDTFEQFFVNRKPLQDHSRLSYPETYTLQSAAIECDASTRFTSCLFCALLKVSIDRAGHFSRAKVCWSRIAEKKPLTAPAHRLHAVTHLAVGRS